MKELNLVMGANGHLGNNLVRLLLEKGEKVRGSVRKIDYKEPFNGLECEIVYADFLNKDSLLKAMESVDTLYVAAAVYKSWAKNVQKEIIDANIEGTRNIIEASAVQGVKKIIYVSSTFTLDHSKVPMDETGWNNDYSEPYSRSKTEAEKLAWNLAKKYNLWMVSILPSGMIGPNCFGHLTPTMEFLTKILTNQIPFDPNFNFNFVDIRDIANMMITASEKGKNGERYILAQEQPISSTEVFEFAHSLNPDTKIPSKPPYSIIYIIASIMECISKITKKKPIMLRSQVKRFSKICFKYSGSVAISLFNKIYAEIPVATIPIPYCESSKVQSFIVLL